MKKSIIVATTLIGIISLSCQKMEPAQQENNEIKTIATASIVDNDGATKTSLDVNTKKLTWTSGDKIYIVAPDPRELFSLNEFNISSMSEDCRSAVFTSSISMTGATSYAAFYGNRASSAKVNYNEYSRGLDYGLSPMTIYLPSDEPYIQYLYPWKQQYDEDGPQSKYLLMRSTRESKTSLSDMEFENMDCIFKFQIKDSRAENRATLDSIKVTSTDACLSGRWYGNRASSVTIFDLFEWMPVWNNCSDYVSFENGGSFGDKVVLYDINTTLASECQNFYIVASPSFYGNNTTRTYGTLTVTLYDNGTPQNTKTVTMTGVKTSKGNIYKFPVIDFGEL